MDKTGLFLTWTQLFVFLAVLVLFYTAELYFIWRRAKKNNFIDHDCIKKLRAIEDELAFVRMQIAGLKSVQQSSFHERVASDDGVEIVSEKNSSYARAIQLAKNGSTSDQLVSSCGLSLAEADLIVSIYRGVYKG